MNYDAAILYAIDQMSKIGFTPNQYSFAPVTVCGTSVESGSGLVIRKAYNELYILVHPDKYFGLFILADNSGFDSDQQENSGEPQFTGVIQLIKTASSWNLDSKDSHGNPVKPIPVEFLRVVY
jgi:hypothetical protein